MLFRHIKNRPARLVVRGDLVPSGDNLGKARDWLYSVPSGFVSPDLPAPPVEAGSMSLTALERVSGASSSEQTPVFAETLPSLSIV